MKVKCVMLKGTWREFKLGGVYEAEQMPNYGFCVEGYYTHDNLEVEGYEDLVKFEVVENANQEYEAACVTAAGCYDRFEGEHKLQQWDEHIATLEAALVKAQEARREIVNFYNLNKCKHDYVWHTGYARWYCSKCEATK